MTGIGQVIATRNYGPYRDAAGDRTMVHLELRKRDNGRIYAAFTGEGYRKHSSHPWAMGQHQGSAPSALVALWDRWHLNDMLAGCEHQEAQFRASPADRPTSYNGYRGVTGITLSPSEGSACPECGYKYGSAWNYEQLPDDFLEQCDAAAQILKEVP